ncbi:MAG: sigma-70 family RNA polymerase sigma factor [Bacteroidales bacterium]|nr:sigma-70 family RNA polymerase sigma factor [Bacteroidales bacterium]
MKQKTVLMDFSDNTDEVLWMSFKEGSKNALSEIFDQHYQNLHSYASRMISNPDEAKDVIQDLFLKLWKNKNQLGKCDNIRFYLLQSLRRLIIDQYLKKYKPIKTEINEENLPSELPFESVLIINQEQDKKIEELKKAFSQLSRRQQEAIYLKFYQQIDYPAIATIMNVTVQSVRNLVHSGIQSLKHHFGTGMIFFIALLKKV